MDDEEIGSFFRTRRGMSLSERLRAGDSYGLLLQLTLLTLVSMAFGDWPVGRMLAVVMLDGSLLFAMHTSRAGRAMLRFAVILAILAFVAGSATVVIGAHDAQIGITSGIAAMLVLTAMVAIVRRLVTHPVVSGATILGALCVYVLIGMFFASVYGVIDAVGSLFVQQGEASTVDYLYFSYVTIATVGYGDLTAKGDLARMLAVTEALTGQLYLVSVVALVVGNLGRARRPREGTGSR